MEKDFWKTTSLTKILPCPHCSVGLLKPIENSFQSHKTKASLQLEIESRGQYPSTDFHFAGILKCNNCGDIVTTCGSWTEDRQGIDIVEDPKTGVLTLSEPDKFFFPKYFYPNLKLFKIPTNTPEKVKECINESFALYWSDKSSCLNKIRVALEYLLDNQKIESIAIVNSGKKYQKPIHKHQKRMSLHERIDRFSKKNKELGKYLVALKKLGNEASHSNTIDNVEIILNAYETLEYVLNNLYNKPEIIK
jgi:hypothetical protein